MTSKLHTQVTTVVTYSFMYLQAQFNYMKGTTLLMEQTSYPRSFAQEMASMKLKKNVYFVMFKQKKCNIGQHLLIPLLGGGGGLP